MGQISFKIPDSEMEFLYWFAEKNAQPISVIYRNATLESFQEWKKEILLNEYQNGNIGFKQFCKLSGISFNQGTLLMQQNNIEPTISEIIDLYTNQVRDSLTVTDVLRSRKVPKRKPSINKR